MPKSDRFKILYNKEIVFSNLPKNSVAYNIIKHMVEKRDFKYE